MMRDLNWSIKPQHRCCLVILFTNPYVKVLEIRPTTSKVSNEIDGMQVTKVAEAR